MEEVAVEDIIKYIHNTLGSYTGRPVDEQQFIYLPMLSNLFLRSLILSSKKRRRKGPVFGRL